jgi:hypothetical protein
MTGSLSPLLSNTTMKSHYYGNVRPVLHHNTKYRKFSIVLKEKTETGVSPKDTRGKMMNLLIKPH